jgi:RHS repeat-associated protein
LLSDSERTFTYDHTDRLVSVSEPGSAFSFEYDGLGNRYLQTLDAVTTTYSLDLAAGLTEVLSDGTDTYLYGLGRIGGDGSGGWAYHLGDALGSLRQLTDTSAEVTLTQSFEPFGAPLSSTGTGSSEFGFTGEQDDILGLVFLRARYYDPESGRFITKDPFPGFTSLPSTLHPFIYGLNNPATLVDPSGRSPILAALGIAGIIGGIGGAISHALSNPCQSLGDLLSSPDFWKSVAVGVVTGLVSGLMIGVLGGLGIVGIGFWSTVGIGAFTGGVTGGFAEGLTQLLTHGRIVDTGSILTAGLFGAISGGIFSAVGYGLGRALRWRGKGYIEYGDLDELGRPTGVNAKINSEMIGTGTRANPSIKPPGFGGGGAGHSRGHLIARILGGSGDDARNLVTLYQNPVNSPVMRGYDSQMRAAIEAGETILYKVTPLYQGSNGMPAALTLRATGSKGFDLLIKIINQQ